MSNESKLGTIPNGTEGRDAVHVAIVPVRAAEMLSRGVPVKLNVNGEAVVCAIANAVGVVDPFLPEHQIDVPKGAWFWPCLYPKTITSLCHVWQHPQFPEAGLPRKPSKEESEQWLRDWIKTADCPGYEITIAAALGDYVEQVEGYGKAYCIEDYGCGPCLLFAGRDAHSGIPDEFWDHLENATGRKAPTRAKRFACSC